MLAHFPSILNELQYVLSLKYAWTFLSGGITLVQVEAGTHERLKSLFKDIPERITEYLNYLENMS